MIPTNKLGPFTNRFRVINKFFNKQISNVEDQPRPQPQSILRQQLSTNLFLGLGSCNLNLGSPELSQSEGGEEKSAVNTDL